MPVLLMLLSLMRALLVEVGNFLREMQSVREHVNELSPIGKTENSKQLKALTILNHIEKEILHTFGCCFPLN